MRKVPRKVIPEGRQILRKVLAEGFCGRFRGRFPEGFPRKVEKLILTKNIISFLNERRKDVDPSALSYSATGLIAELEIEKWDDLV